MAYHEILIMQVWEVVRQWHQGHNISQIARALYYDRTTIRSYKRLATLCGLSREKPLPSKDEVVRLLEDTVTRADLDGPPF